MSSDLPPSLRQLATTVWQIWSPDSKDQRERAVAEQEKRTERFRTALVGIVGEGFDINININGGCIEAMIDDLRFIAFEMISPDSKTPLTLVTLLGRCPSCGTETMSEPFYNLAGLGKLLENFEPLFHHLCLLSQVVVPTK